MMAKRGSRKISSQKRNWILVADEETVETYSNIALVRSTATDFMIDFGVTNPEYAQSKKKGMIEFPADVRIYISPLFIPKLINALQTRFVAFQKQMEKDAAKALTLEQKKKGK